MNLFIFEEKIMLNEQKLNYFKNIGLGLNFIYEFEVCYIGIVHLKSNLMCHMPYFIWHLSHVTCHMSPVKCQFFSSLPNLPHFGWQNSECLEEHWWKFSQKKLSFLNASFTTKPSTNHDWWKLILKHFDIFDILWTFRVFFMIFIYLFFFSLFSFFVFWEVFFSLLRVLFNPT